MLKQKKESFFWTSYSDLMTSLFFIMLVLFVLTVVLLHKQMVEVGKKEKATQSQIDKIKEIEEAVNNIDTTYFEYNKVYKKYVLKIRVNFQKGKFDMNDIDINTRNQLLKAGGVIQNSLKKIDKKYPKIEYLLIIEGQASRDSYSNNYELSYQRALSLRRFWMKKHIDFGSNCEVLICGSGVGGVMRESNERLNQRFLINIVPKPGIIEASK